MEETEIQQPEPLDGWQDRQAAAMEQAEQLTLRVIQLDKRSKDAINRAQAIIEKNS